MKAAIRANYSNPPAHGASVVATILSNDALRAIWEQELTDMRQRIQRMRQLFVNTLQEKGANRDFSFIIKQNGMFSFSGPDKRTSAASARRVWRICGCFWSRKCGRDDTR
ncbi:aspartate aminotransferase [Escherichia coli]|uniref:Aspartate aminotransferase n=1 Tax=Escherichia coli TaxID=562 RepID=A0A2X3K060_ECOLX|nr:aspartate aminotransferase [Escherichia coli]